MSETLLPAGEKAPGAGTPKKVGIIRCRQTEEYCPGTTDFKVAATGKLAFKQFGPVEVVGFISCGGCPGKAAVGRAAEMAKRGAEVIAFASCIFKGNPIGMPCPNAQAMRDAIARKLPEITILEWTH